MKLFALAFGLSFSMLSALAQRPMIFGQTTGMYVYDIPDTTVKIGQGCNYLLYYHLDLDGNNEFDCEFSTACGSTGISSQYNVSVKTFDSTYLFVDSLTPEIRYRTFDTTYYNRIAPTTFEQGDTLKPGFHLVSKWSTLASFGALHDTHERYEMNKWLGGTYYLGFRKYRQADTLMGWIKMSVPSYTKFIILEYALNKAVIGMQEQAHPANWSLYPNPAGELLNVRHDKPGRLTITDISGRKLIETRNEGITSVIDIAQLTRGIYFITCTDEDRTITRKFMKQ